MPIHILSDDMVNKIAAGEVVERPASVVKELVENAIDAGADSIEVSYEEGGMEQIRVRDNGSGVAPDDIPLVFQRHATSKVSDIDDLEKIGTMGFRGEALASIAAVSIVTLKTRTQEQDIGSELTVSFGDANEVSKSGVPVGTEITVKELFKELPARRKYLKSAQTETNHINAVMTGFALSYPEIGFEVKRGPKSVLHAPKTDSTRARLDAIWDDGTTGKLHEVFFEHPHMTVRGFVGTPQLSGKSAQQWVFVNRRHIEDRSIFAAVREGYSGLLPPKGRPFFILYIETPTHMVDVNVHPRKKEVRFASGQFVFNGVKDAVRSALSKQDMTPVIERESVRESFSPNYSPQAGNFGNKSHRNTAPTGVSPEKYVPDSRGMILNDAAFTDKPSAPLPWEERRSGEHIRFETFDNVYVFVFGDEGITVYDQHALHERVLYEDFKNNIEQGIEKGDVQSLLIPQKVTFSPEQFGVYEEHHDVLTKLGFEITAHDDRQIEITGVPVALKDASIQSLLPDVLEEWSGMEPIAPDQDIRIATMACRAAVKAGDPLSDIEVASLLERVSVLDEKYTCPHGRPFKVILERKELDNWFKRTGF